MGSAQKFILCILFAVTVFGSPVFAAAAVNYNKPWTFGGYDSAGRSILVRDLGAPLPSGNIAVGISGVNGYNNISQGANGAVLSRTLPLVNDAGIIRGTEAQLAKPIAATAADTVLASSGAISAAGRLLLRNAIPVVGAGITVYQLYNALSDDGITYNAGQNTLTKRYNQNPNVQYYIPGKVSSPGTGWTVTSYQSCPAGTTVSGYGGIDACFISYTQMNGGAHLKNTKKSNYTTTCDGKTSGSCSYTVYYSQTGDYPPYSDVAVQVSVSVQGISCPSGYYPSGSTCYADFPATDAQIEAGLNNQPVASLPTLVQEIADKGDGTISLPNNSSSGVTIGQSSYSTAPTVTTSTITNPDGSTSVIRTEKSQAITPHVNGSTLADQNVTYDISNVTNVYNNGTLVQTTTEEQPPAKPTSASDPCANGACAFSDPSMPGQPQLYEQKYPAGIVGVWNANKTDLANTQFVQGISQMFPSMSGSGTCPVWTVDVNLGASMYANYGTHDISVPCWIWTVIGNIVLLYACFTARNILFG